MPDDVIPPAEQQAPPPGQPVITTDQQAFLASFDVSKLNAEQQAFFQANFAKLGPDQLALLASFDILKLNPAQLTYLASVKPDTDPNAFMVGGFPALLGMTPRTADPKIVTQTFAALMNIGVSTYSQEGYTTLGAAAWAIVNAGRELHADNGDSGSGERRFEAYKQHLDTAISTINATTDPRVAIALLAARNTLSVDGYFWQSTEIPKATQEYIDKYDKRDAATVVTSVLTSLGSTQGLDARVSQHLTTTLSGIDPKALKLFDINLRASGLLVATDGSNVDACARQMAQAIATAAEGLSPADRQKLCEALMTLGSQRVNSQDYARISLFKGFLAARSMIENPGTETDSGYIPNTAEIALIGIHLNRDDSVPIFRLLAPAAPEQPASQTENPAPLACLNGMTAEGCASDADAQKAAAGGVALFNNGDAHIVQGSAMDRAIDATIEQQLKTYGQAHHGDFSALKITIIGSADGTGTAAQNDKLSLDRANAEAAEVLEVARRMGITGAALDQLRANIHTEGQGQRAATAGQADKRHRSSRMMFSA